MRRNRLSLLGLLVLTSCTRHVGYDPDQGQKLQHVAIIVRMTGSASAEVPDALLGGQLPEKVAKQLDQNLNQFETSERLRSALVEHLPDQPPWNSIVPTVQAETVLGSLLTVDRPVKPPEFDLLQQIGVDGVLYIQIERWGARTDDGKSGLFMAGTGKFLTLPDHDTIWQSKLESASGNLGERWAEPYPLREKLDEVAAQLGEHVALQLGGTPQSVQRTPSLETPDIEDKGHPPEKLQPVIPFQYQLRDAGAPPDAGGIDISLGDGGIF